MHEHMAAGQGEDNLKQKKIEVAHQAGDQEEVVEAFLTRTCGRPRVGREVDAEFHFSSLNVVAKVVVLCAPRVRMPRASMLVSDQGQFCSDLEFGTCCQCCLFCAILGQGGNTFSSLAVSPAMLATVVMWEVPGGSNFSWFQPRHRGADRITFDRFTRTPTMPSACWSATKLARAAQDRAGQRAR